MHTGEPLGLGALKMFFERRALCIVQADANIHNVIFLSGRMW